MVCSCEIIIKINFPLSSNITELHTPAAPCNVSPSVNPVSNLTSVSDHDWVVIDGHALSYDDKLVISNKKWLNDNIIYIGQLLIKRLCPDTNGFYSSQLGKRYQFGKTSSPFIQVLHIKRSHWMVVSTVECEPGTVNVYDSAYNHINIDTKRQIASIVRLSKSEIVMRSMNIQRQPNSSDCGLFALAVATELAQQRDPRLCYWDASKMRDHLLSSFERNAITSFPLAKCRRVPLGSNYKHTITVKIFCVCRMPNDPNKAMIQCNSCKEWLHYECIGLHIDYTAAEFTCFKCQRKY